MSKLLKILSCWLLVISCNISATTVKDGLALLNQKKNDEAKTVFKFLAEQKNARALFWLGVTQFRTGEQFQASSSLHKAAEAGDPWAMHLMVPSYNKYCDYLGWPCDESWMDKAIEGWKKLADSGDGNAMYALLLWGDKPWWVFVPILNKKKYGELVEEAVKAGGYKAASFNAGIPLKIEKRVELLEYAAGLDYAPAMLDLYSANENYIDLGIDERKILEDILFLGMGGGVLIYHLENMLPKINKPSDLNGLTAKDNKILSDLYYYSLINKKITGDLNFKPFVDVYNDKDDLVRMELISENEKKKIEEKAREFLIDFKPNSFLDEASGVSALLR